jgi:hypothetical protein
MSSTDKAIIASVDWRDDKAGIKGTSRMVIAADGTRVVAVKGECIEATDADAELVAACAKALATLDPDVKDRVDLTATAPITSPDLKLDDKPLHAKTPPMVVPHPDDASPRTDARPIVVGASLIALAAVFYWNRRRRERFEKDQAS